MEKWRREVAAIAFARDYGELSVRQRSLVPFLSFASSLYRAALSLRSFLYSSGVFSKRRLPLPVISVGNLTWGGNGKTPMVELLAGLLADSGIAPLILTRGYAGGDEARMLRRHLGRSAKIGVGADRAAISASLIEKYGCFDPRTTACSERGFSDQRFRNHSQNEAIGAVILDDGMQHWRLWRDLDIVMVNGLRPWGNGQLLPLGPLREPFTALRRADIAIIHNADLVPRENLKCIEHTIREVKDAIPIFYSRMAPVHLFEADSISSQLPLEALIGNTVLCVSGIGSASAFVNGVEKLGAICVDRIDYSDHHIFERKDIQVIKKRLAELENQYDVKPIVVITEKDYDRDPEILKHFQPYKVWVVCAQLQFVSHEGCSKEYFKSLLMKHLKVEL